MEYTVEVSSFERDEAGRFIIRRYDVNAPIKQFAEDIARAMAHREGLVDPKVDACWRREAFDVPVGME